MNSMSGKELAKFLERNGWILLRVQGSHHIYGKPGIQARISVPIHGNKSLKIGLLKHLLKKAGLLADSGQQSDTSEAPINDDISSSDATEQEID